MAVHAVPFSRQARRAMRAPVSASFSHSFCTPARAYICGFFAALGVLVSSQDSHAHEDFELDITGGYAFGTRLSAGQEDASGEPVETVDAEGEPTGEVQEGDFRMRGGFAFSGIFGYRMQPNGFIYFSYTRQQTEADYQATGANGVDLNTDASLEYFQFGGNVEMTRGIIVPYLGVSLGLARIAALGAGGDGARLFFAPVIDGGFKVDLHRHVHLRFLGRMPVVFTNKELFCTADSGCATVDKVKAMAQLQLHGGVGVSF